MEPEKASALDPLTKVALESLKDIAVPEPVSWFPQTFGWAVVGLLVSAVIVFFLWRWLQTYRANAYRRQALIELGDIERRIRDPETRHDAIDDLAELLKRVALVAWRREDVASLSGAAWVDFLEKQCDQDEMRSLRTLLDSFEYSNDSGLSGISETISGNFISSAKAWIRRHHVSA